jgi:hypothetical protein
MSQRGRAIEIVCARMACRIVLTYLVGFEGRRLVVVVAAGKVRGARSLETEVVCGTLAN